MKAIDDAQGRPSEATALKQIPARVAMSFVARFGYGARGVVYLTIGGWAAFATLSLEEHAPGANDVLQNLSSTRVGLGILFFLAAGIVCFAAWRLIQTFLDTDRHGTSLRGLAIRASLAVGAFDAALLGFFAVSLVLGWTIPGSQEQSVKIWTARVLATPAGEWLVGIPGVAVVLAGVALVAKGWSGPLDQRLNIACGIRRWAIPVCRFGLIARGVTVLLIGAYLVEAAIRFDVSDVDGLRGALRVLERQPQGALLLGVVAAGLFAFGIYSLLQAACRRLDVARRLEPVTKLLQVRPRLIRRNRQIVGKAPGCVGYDRH